MDNGKFLFESKLEQCYLECSTLKKAIRIIFKTENIPAKNFNKLKRSKNQQKTRKNIC